jgi:hypothetical protein
MEAEMTQQPNNVSAAGVLTDDLIERCRELEELATVGQSEQAALNRLAGTYRSDISPHDRKAMARNQTHHEAMRFVLAAASAQATAPVGWFVQRSSFGPWIEVERYEDGAVRLHRMDGDQATGPAVTEGYKLVPAEPTDEMVDAACPVGEVVDHFDMKMALRSGIAAAPSPAAREAGDGVSAAFAKYDALIGSLEGCTDGGCVIRPPKGMHTNGGCRCVRHAMKMQRMAYAAAQLRKDLGTLLREAGSR